MIDRIEQSENPTAARAELVQTYRATFGTPYKAAELGFIDEISRPEALRARLHMLADKKQSVPARKHGNIPL